MNRAIRLLAGAALLLCAYTPASAQETARAEQLRVFIDCSYYCDMDFMRTELGWVDYMRDRTDADVHVLVTSATTGGGGQRFTLEFTGLRSFAGVVDTMTYTATSEDSEDTRRRALTRTIAIGLLRYIAGTPQADRLSISLGRDSAAAQQAAPAAPQHDPWDYWTFRIGTDAFMNGESSYKNYSFHNSINASRTTEAWKLSFTVSGNYNEQSFTYPVDDTRDTTVTSISRNYNASNLTVKSITPHLSIGARASAGTSTYANNKLTLSVQPAIEYNLFPYSESTRRQLTMLYAAGARVLQYRDTTIFNQIEETRPLHSVAVGYTTRQRWGSVEASITGSQYLHDTSKYNASISGGVSELRLFRGLSLNIYGDYTLVRNQIGLPRGELTQDEILLRRREQATNYTFWMNFGISYRFGSIFNNVVNPRFNNSFF